MSISPQYEQIGNRIREERKQLNWSQNRLALESTVPQCTISKIEAGQRLMIVSTLDRICSALGVSMDYIVRGE